MTEDSNPLHFLEGLANFYLLVKEMYRSPMPDNGTFEMVEKAVKSMEKSQGQKIQLLTKLIEEEMREGRKTAQPR